MVRDEINVINGTYRKDENGKEIFVLKINKNDLEKFLKQLKLNKNNKNNRMMLQVDGYIGGNDTYYKFKNYKDNKNNEKEIELIFSKSKKTKEIDKYEWDFIDRKIFGDKYTAKEEKKLRLIENTKEYIDFLNKTLGKKNNEKER